MDMKALGQKMREDIKRLMLAIGQAKSSHDAGLMEGVAGKSRRWVSDARREIEEYVK